MQKAELLASRLQENNLLQKDMLASHYKKRNTDLSIVFRVDGPLCYCYDITSLPVFKKLGEDHIASEWHLFLDYSKRNLKAVLLHNGNIKSSIPKTHLMHLKECYKSIKICLDAIQYNEYKWYLCGNLKIISILIRLQEGFTKHCCFLCLWYSRTTAKHYIRKDWPSRVTDMTGNANIKEVSLVNPINVLMPPLHKKLDLMKNLIKQLGKRKPNEFVFLCNKFPNKSEVKLKEGIFAVLQIRKILKDSKFEEKLASIELRAWKAFKWLCGNFLENKRSPSLKMGVENLLELYKEMGCRMLPKIHFYILTGTFFQLNLGAISDEQDFTRTLKQWRPRCQDF